MLKLGQDMALVEWIQQLGLIASAQAHDKDSSALPVCPLFPHRSWFAWKFNAVNSCKHCNITITTTPFHSARLHHPSNRILHFEIHGNKEISLSKADLCTAMSISHRRRKIILRYVSHTDQLLFETRSRSSFKEGLLIYFWHPWFGT